MQIETQNSAEGLRLRVMAPRIDAATALAFKEKIREVVQPDGSAIVLDLATVSFIDSSGLGALVSLHKALHDVRGITFTNLSPAVAQVFRLTRLDEVLHVLAPQETHDAS